MPSVMGAWYGTDCYRRVHLDLCELVWEVPTNQTKSSDDCLHRPRR